jgi:hypothetical protein
MARVILTDRSPFLDGRESGWCAILDKLNAYLRKLSRSHPEGPQLGGRPQGLGAATQRIPVIAKVLEIANKADTRPPVSQLLKAQITGWVRQRTYATAYRAHLQPAEKTSLSLRENCGRGAFSLRQGF